MRLIAAPHLRRLLLALLLVTGAATAQEEVHEPFAGLSIEPAGRQLFDVSTGVTKLPDGGVIIDRATGVSVNAAEIEYLPGDYVTAVTVSVDGEFGTVTASSLRIDLADGVLEADGPLELTRGGLSVKAGALTYHGERAVALFEGGVEGSTPRFSADRLLLDALSGDVLLDGEYEYADGLFVMESPTGGGQLALVFTLLEGEPAYDAATEVSAEILERFKGLL